MSAFLLWRQLGGGGVSMDKNRSLVSPPLADRLACSVLTCSLLHHFWNAMFYFRYMGGNPKIGGKTPKMDGGL